MPLELRSKIGFNPLAVERKIWLEEISLSRADLRLQKCSHIQRMCSCHDSFNN